MEWYFEPTGKTILCVLFGSNQMGRQKLLSTMIPLRIHYNNIVENVVIYRRKYEVRLC
jgi:hypothetical protein